MSDVLTRSEDGALIAARKLSPVELTKDCLAIVHAVDGVLNSFILLTEERSLAEAKAAEAEIMQSGPKSSLHGTPIGLRDRLQCNL